MSETTKCCHCIECKANPRLRKKTPEEEEVLRLLRRTEEERLQEIAEKEKQSALDAEAAMRAMG